jgi:hypothetical protein
MWFALQIVFIVLGLLLVFGSNQLGRPILMQAGIVCLGLAMIVMGWEAIITRKLVRRKRRGYRVSYTGIPAIFQGIQYNFTGLFMIGVASMMYFNNGREIFLQAIRRPGLLLVVLGGLALLQAMIMFWGTWQTRENSPGRLAVGWPVVNLLPGLIWLALGLGLMLLGLFDALAPARFDEMGGRLLEELYGAR